MFDLFNWFDLDKVIIIIIIIIIIVIIIIINIININVFIIVINIIIISCCFLRAKTVFPVWWEFRRYQMYIKDLS